MTERGPIPVTVITGFLGAGKTTLLNGWLGAAPRGDIAVIVNEYGSVGIDGALLAARARTLVEITGGCICCATQGELVAALAQLTSSASPPKRIVIETSGAASPSGVIHAVSGSARRGEHGLDGIVTVVDATRVGALAEHDLAIEQIGYADIVALSRIDLCEPETIDAAEGAVASHNGAAFVVHAAAGAIADARYESLSSLLDARRTSFAPTRHVPAARPHAVYESISLVIEGEVDGERFAELVESELAGASGRIFRTKGVLHIAGVAPPMIVQGVGDLVDVTFDEAALYDGREDAPRTSRLVVVGFGLDRDKLARAFAACAATHAREGDYIGDDAATD